jgi:hypothetical protein
MLTAVLFGYGCVNLPRGQAADTTVAVEVVHRAGLCPGASSSPKAVWIDSQEKLERYWARMHSHRIGTDKPPIPKNDWDAHGLILVLMGEKPSGGYGLELLRPQAVLKDGIVYLGVKWKEPPADALVAMMITSPCLLVKIETGPFQSVIIVDPSGRRRAKVDL